MKFLKEYTFVLFSVLLMCGCNIKEKNNDQIREVTADHKQRIGARLTSLNEAIKKNPENAENYFRRAEVNITAGNFNQAVEDAVKALNLDSAQGKYHLALAKANMGMAQYNAALKSALKAEQLSMNSPELYITLGEIYSQLKQYDKALTYLDKALHIAPYEEKAYFYKGVVYEATGDTTKAIASYRTSVKQNVAYTEGYNALAEIFINKRDFETASAYVEAGLRLSPEDGSLVYSKGLIYFHTDQPDSARAFFKKAIFYNPDMYMANYNLGMLSYKAKNYAEAIPYFESVINQKSNMDAAHYHLAICNMMLGKGERGIMHYEKAVAIGGPYAKDAATALYRIKAQSAPKPVIQAPKLITPRPIIPKPIAPKPINSISGAED